MKSRLCIAMLVIIVLMVQPRLFSQNGDYITNMVVYDQENAQDWSIQSNLQVSDQQFGDRTYTFTSIPEKYLGSEWIRTANDSKAYAGDTLVSFKVTDSVDVLVAFDDRLELRNWLTGWKNTGDDLNNSESAPKTFSLYKKAFVPHDVVALGSVNQTSGTNNYTVLVQPRQSEMQTPDPFDFFDRLDVPPNRQVVSMPTTITGLSQPTGISVTNGSFSINDGAFQSQPGIIANNDQLRIMLLSAPENGQVTTTRVTIGTSCATFSVRTEDDPRQGWPEVPDILARIQAPVFPERQFLLTDYNAVGDGESMCTRAFADAIAACHEAGGGTVVVPEGTYLTGAIHLKSNVNLYLASNAVIKFSQHPNDFLPVVFSRFEGTECYNFSPPIYAFEQENIAITGSGILDGGGDSQHWWPWKNTGGADVNTLRQQAEDGIPVEQRLYGDGHYLRPNMIQPYRCKNVLIDGVTIQNSPMWHIHPVLCENVTITNVTVVGHGPNNDGCNPESCTDVLINNCYFNTGDDCIAIKSGRNADGRRIDVPTTYVVIQECTMKDGHGGVVIGSEMTGGANHIFAEDCYMDSPNLDRVLRIKTNSMRGGIVEHVYLRNITVGQVSDAFFRVNFYYGEGDAGGFTPIVRNVTIENVICKQSNYALRLVGYARSPIRNIRLKNCRIVHAQSNNLISQVENLILDGVAINGEYWQKIINPVAVTIVAVDDEKIVHLPETIRLMQNYPNPFNPVTRIGFEISQSGPVRLSVYNARGQEVALLVDKNLKAGFHAVVFNARQLNSGLYFCKLAAEQQIQTRKMILLR